MSDNYAVILNDKETWTNIEGCEIRKMHNEELPIGGLIAKLDVWEGKVSIETYGAIIVNGRLIGSGN